MRSMKIYLLAAAAIAGCAFAVGQLVPGAGIILVIAATTLWSAFSAKRMRENAR